MRHELSHAGEFTNPRTFQLCRRGIVPGPNSWPSVSSLVEMFPASDRPVFGTNRAAFRGDTIFHRSTRVPGWQPADTPAAQPHHVRAATPSLPGRPPHPDTGCGAGSSEWDVRGSTVPHWLFAVGRSRFTVGHSFVSGSEPTCYVIRRVPHECEQLLIDRVWSGINMS